MEIVTAMGIGWLFQDDSADAKLAADKYIQRHGGYPAVLTLPCGNRACIATYESLMTMTGDNIPCPCGDPTHWLIIWGLQAACRLTRAPVWW